MIMPYLGMHIKRPYREKDSSPIFTGIFDRSQLELWREIGYKCM